MLTDAGEEAPGLDDLNTQQERTLGKLVAEQLGTDFYFLDRFPADLRPFYTMPCPDDARYTNSYDVFLRGAWRAAGARAPCNRTPPVPPRCCPACNPSRRAAVPCSRLQPSLQPYVA